MIFSSLLSILSHPMRVRGLKPCRSPCTPCRWTSHPMRVRGLKLEDRKPIGIKSEVAPHAGAWIETSYARKYALNGLVAPHAGAWIETSPRSQIASRPTSHPMRVRGLKLHIHRGIVAWTAVAPHAGAWIETYIRHNQIKQPICRTPCGCVD